MNMNEHDDEFDLRISKRERLLPQFDAELDGPDADTDRVLLARARAASHPVQLRAAAAKTFRAPRWAVPVGLAATLVLSFTLLLHTSPPQVAAPASAPMASQAVSDSMVSESAIGESATGGSAIGDVPLSDRAVGAAAAGASAPAQTRERRADNAEPARAAADFAADAMPAEVQIEPTLAAKAMPAAASPAPAPPPPPAVAAEMSANVAGSADLDRSARTAPAESATDASKERAEAAAPLDPDVWLRRIEQLRSRGLDAEARRELLAFRQQFPDHPLPAALQALLPAP